MATFDPIGALAGQDDAMLSRLLEGLRVEDAGLSEMLRDLQPEVPKQLGEDTADLTPPVEPITQPGDLWLMGDHRLLCGDSTKREDVERLMDGERAYLCVTSPPYWIGRKYEHEYGYEEIVQHIGRAAQGIASAMAEQAHVVINTGTTVETKQGGTVRRVWLLLDQWAAALATRDWCMRNVRIWRKEGGFSSFSPSQDVVGQDWEFLASFTRPKPRAQNRVRERWALDGVWDCQPQTRAVGHAAPFPVEIPARYIALYTDSGDLVVEPYCGSGTTIVAAEQLDRRCYAMEIDPVYCDVVVRRWETLTGRQAVRERAKVAA